MLVFLCWIITEMNTYAFAIFRLLVCVCVCFLLFFALLFAVRLYHSRIVPHFCGWVIATVLALNL